MATIAVQKITRAGITPSYAAAVGPDAFANDGQTFLHAKNTNAAPRTVTVAATVNPLPVGTQLQNVAVTVPATTGDKMFGPFPGSAFNQADNTCAVTYDATANLTIGAFTIAP